MRGKRHPGGGFPHPILVVLALLSALFAHGKAQAAGHGPLFGLATPVNNKGGWSFDTGFMGRETKAGSDNMLRFMAAYGLTRDFQLSLSAPLNRANGPMGSMGMRGLGMMPVTDEIEAMAAYRFHHKDIGIGRRREDTAYLAVSFPNGDITRHGAFVALAHGDDISRETYLWEGIGYKAWERGGTHPGNQLFYSVVFGYRPKAWQTEYPKPDFRLLLELIGELQERGEHNGQTMANSGGHRLALAPGVLGTYRSWGFSFGVAIPLIHDRKGDQPRERLRYGVDVTYFH